MTKKVVLIEDNEDNAEVVRITLEQYGIKVFSETDGESGLSTVRKTRPDAVILDIMVPKMNGYEVCTSMQQDPELQGIPIMILTGLTRGNHPEQDADWRGKLEVAEFLSKPFEPDDLAKRVLMMLGVS